MPKRTPDNCKYIRRCGEPGRDSNGKCMGFSRAGDDEPIEACNGANTAHRIMRNISIFRRKENYE